MVIWNAMKPLRWTLFFAVAMVSRMEAQDQGKSLFYSAPYVNGSFESVTLVNDIVGANIFYNSGFFGSSTVIGNVEGGHIWFGHEVFNRQVAGQGLVTYDNTESVNELDFHATTVGHVLAGSGYVDTNGGQYQFTGMGMAPNATLVSGAIATEFSADSVGGFSITDASMIQAYHAFFYGVGLGTAKPDVINSSWGGAEPAADSYTSVSLDGMAKANASVAFVVAAGNDGAGVPVSAPGSGYNNISVGSLGGANFLTPSSFTSNGKVDVYNPQTGQTYSQVRVAVDMSAPGESLYLAAYLGGSGSIGAALPAMVQDPVPTDRYFINMDGTSYAAPTVSGGIALLKDVAKTDALFNHIGNDDAFDTRVMKSVLMASSTKTDGWNNAMSVVGGVQVTTQALDVNAGAGALNLSEAVGVYLFGTRELDTDQGGVILADGWDASTVPLGDMVNYQFAESFQQGDTLQVALNWFIDRTFTEAGDLASEVGFANLDLQVWMLDGNGNFDHLVAESKSLYNNTEFLRLEGLDAGRYGLRVVYQDNLYDLSGTLANEYYGLSWNSIPEVGSVWYGCFGFLVLLGRRRKK